MLGYFIIYKTLASIVKRIVLFYGHLCVVLYRSYLDFRIYVHCSCWDTSIGSLQYTALRLNRYWDTNL